jgi:hypothetical protein
MPTFTSCFATHARVYLIKNEGWQLNTFATSDLILALNGSVLLQNLHFAQGFESVAFTLASKEIQCCPIQNY